MSDEGELLAWTVEKANGIEKMRENEIWIEKSVGTDFDMSGRDRKFEKLNFWALKETRISENSKKSFPNPAKSKKWWQRWLSIQNYPV